MSQRILRFREVETPKSAPVYEVRARRHRPGDTEIEVWQLPSPASPHLKEAARVAGLRGRNLDLIEHRVLKLLARVGIKLSGRESERKEGHRLPEDLALTLGLVFRTLAPMRSRERMRDVAEGIEAMGKEEAAYWLGMAMHRKHPRRVLTALRYLLTDPKRG